MLGYYLYSLGRRLAPEALFLQTMEEIYRIILLCELEVYRVYVAMLNMVEYPRSV